MRLQARSLSRKAIVGLRKPKGIVFVIIGLLMVTLWLGPALYTARRHRSDPQLVQMVVPLVLLMVSALNIFTSAGERAISFTPGEVNFLFPGPYTRRELLIYKLTKLSSGAFATGTLLSIVLLQHAHLWLGAFFGAVLSLLFIQYFTLSVLLIGQTVGERAYSRGRQVAGAIIVLAIAIALMPVISNASHLTPLEAARQVQHSPIARVMLAPLSVFGRVFTAEHYVPDLIGWGALALMIDLALAAFVVRLDANYMERALVSSEKMALRATRIRHGNVLAGPAKPRGALGRISVPQLPWLGGAGPVARRQLTTVLRSGRAMLMILFVVAVAIAPAAVFGRREEAAKFLLPAIGWMTIFFASMLRFDFRGDLDQMEWLKSLPIRPGVLAAGEMIAPVALLTLLHFAVLITAAVMTPPPARVWFLCTLPFMPAFNVIVFAAENGLFLLFPTRAIAAAPADLSNVGRQIVYFALKMLTLTITCGVATLFGAISFAVAGHSLMVGLAAGLAVLTIEAALLVPCVGWTFKRFDASADMPT